MQQEIFLYVITNGVSLNVHVFHEPSVSPGLLTPGGTASNENSQIPRGQQRRSQDALNFSHLS